MAMRNVVTAVLAGAIALSPALQAGAQSADGPLKTRIQSKIEAEARAKIEGKIAAMPDPAEIAKVSQVQTALNFFEFDAGPVDGVMGDQTRAAIQAYQAYLDYSVTGQLTQEEGQFLVGSYRKAEENPDMVAKATASHPDGVKGLLLVFRDTMDGKDAPKEAAAVGVIPSFSVGGEKPGLTGRCAKLAEAGLRSDAVAGPGTTDAATLSLSLAFCEVRNVVIVESKAAARTTGLPPDEITQQCLAFAPALVSLVAGLPESTPPDAMAAAAAFVQRSGQAPDQMVGIATTCLGVGYEAERMDLAIGSALLLAGLGKPAYGELLGHHLALGFGAEDRPDLAQAWYDAALAAGGDALFGGTVADRVPRLLAAVEVLAIPQ